MGRFKSPRQAQRFLSAHDQIACLFRPKTPPPDRQIVPSREKRCFGPVGRVCSGLGRLSRIVRSTLSRGENNLTKPSL
jgi:hypothetical protein